MVIAGVPRNTPSEEVVNCVLMVALGAANCEAEAAHTTRKIILFGIIRSKSMKEKAR